METDKDHLRVITYEIAKKLAQKQDNKANQDAVCRKCENLTFISAGGLTGYALPC